MNNDTALPCLHSDTLDTSNYYQRLPAMLIMKTFFPNLTNSILLCEKYCVTEPVNLEIPCLNEGSNIYIGGAAAKWKCFCSSAIHNPQN